MNIDTLISELGYNLLLSHPENPDIKNGYTSDLLSDVIANADEDSCLITIQAHKNSIAVASLIGITLIVLCNDREASPEMLEAAKKEHIAIATTTDNQFTTSYKIYQMITG